MVFSSLTFLFFFLPSCLMAYYSAHSRKWRNGALFGFSVLFYAWGEPIYVGLFLASIFLNWALALAIGRAKSARGRLLGLGITLNLLGIGVFKYGDFIVENLAHVFDAGWRVPGLALPIGISFYTFQAISYLVDVYRGDIKPQKNPVFFGTYLAMFSQLIAGPIVRYQTIEAEMLGRREDVLDFVTGLERFCVGLGKKVLIANTMGYMADTLLGATPAIGALPAWVAFVAYAFQIYFDFSGYSDMAIGLGRMFGFHFLENFQYPYTATSITDFWRRWHISLSTFFRDYVYIPLGGNRVGTGRWVLNLLLVWALTGLWHGASWNFVLWGCYYGILLIGEKLIWGRGLVRLPMVVQHLYTIVAFIFGWVVFRINNLAEMAGWMSALLGAHGAGDCVTLRAFGVLHLWPWFLIATIAATPLPRECMANVLRYRFGDLAYAMGMLAVFMWSILSLVMGGFNPFIYFRF